jgi:serine O-acetyltransferase
VDATWPVRRDLRRYFELESKDGHPGLLRKLIILLDTPGLHAGLVFRLGAWVYRRRLRLVRIPFKILHAILRKLVLVRYGIEIDPTARIGGGLYIAHQGGIIIGPVQMGVDCNIAHHVTIGQKPGSGAVPTLGDRVWVGTGSVLYGSITIGDGVTVGPLTVVSRSVPARALVMGNPGRVVLAEHDNSLEIYGPGRASVRAVVS